MNFVSLEQFKQMWEMQDRLNTLTSGPDWTEKGQNWNLAIKSEIMEFFDYIGWKWWKTPDVTKKPTDLQARLELVDIWHFLLSSLIEKSNLGYDSVHRELQHQINNFHQATKGLRYVQIVEELDSFQLNNYTKTCYLSGALIAVGWTWQELYAYYIGKNVLNEFRQENGYKTGEYQKIWEDGEEDNYFLENFVEVLILSERFSEENLKGMLEVKYNQVLLNQSWKDLKN